MHDIGENDPFFQKIIGAVAYPADIFRYIHEPLIRLRHPPEQDHGAFFDDFHGQTQSLPDFVAIAGIDIDIVHHTSFANAVRIIKNNRSCVLGMQPGTAQMSVGPSVSCHSTCL